VADGSLPEEYMTTVEVAALLRRTPGWVYERSRSGELSGREAGKYWLYRCSDVNAFLGTGWTSDLA
jgi:hypothetical protein